MMWQKAGDSDISGQERVDFIDDRNDHLDVEMLKGLTGVFWMGRCT
jgi:hypothetical protein